MVIALRYSALGDGMTTVRGSRPEMKMPASRTTTAPRRASLTLMRQLYGVELSGTVDETVVDQERTSALHPLECGVSR